MELPSRIKVCWFSNHPFAPVTGYSKVSLSIMSRLSKDARFDCSIIGELNAPPMDHNGIPVYGLEDCNNMQKSLVNVLNKINPHIIIFLEDSFSLFNFGFHRINFDPIRTILYIPHDGRFAPSISGLTMMRKVDHIVAMARFTQEVNRLEGFNDEKNHLIYHGTDLGIFHPVSYDKKISFRKSMGFKEDDFVLFSMARNSMRKANQRMIEAFAKASMGNPKLRLLLHISHPFRDDSNLKDFCDRVLPVLVPGSDNIIGRNIFFTEECIKEKNLSEDNIAKCYQMSDMSLSGSTGEGFGLLISESMSCGVPVIHTDYTTAYELLFDTYDGKYLPRGVPVKVITTNIASYNVEHGFIDVADMADKIIHYSSHPDDVKSLAKDCRRFAEDNFNWDEIVEQWKQEIIYTMTE